MENAPEEGRSYVLTREGLSALLGVLRADGHQLVGPTLRDGAITLGELQGLDALPAGWTDAQEAGSYRLRRRDDDALFGYSNGPHSWKQFFFVPRLRLFAGTRGDRGFALEPEPPGRPKLALIAARSCDLHAIEVQDRTFLRGPFVDPDYAARRQGVFVVGVNCSHSGGTCFCVSMETGPRLTSGFDLALTELVPGRRFLVESGSVRGRTVLGRVPVEGVTEADQLRAEELCEATARAMGRSLETRDIKELLYRNLEHPRWDDVAKRCLACTNCTLVCPTCFCGTVEDASDVTGRTAERWRRWDSCFALAHSYLHGGCVRHSIRARYRQWLTHKVASWIDQFGRSGCVGCGRCITWCPVGIDITEELAAIRATESPSQKDGEDEHRRVP